MLVWSDVRGLAGRAGAALEVALDALECLGRVDRRRVRPEVPVALGRIDELRIDLPEVARPALAPRFPAVRAVDEVMPDPLAVLSTAADVEESDDRKAAGQPLFTADE